jgi:hypothetical protein
VIRRHDFVRRRVHGLVTVDRDAVADLAVESVVYLRFAYRRKRVDTSVCVSDSIKASDSV